MRELLCILFGLVLFLLTFNMEAQRPKHDYNLIFGGKDMGGGLISFSEKEDTVAFIPIPGEEFQCNLSTNTISMSDREGKFIFYSEGCKIYTSDHDIMKGSEGLKIADDALWDLWCETQDYRIHLKNLIAIPMMEEGHENKYHLIYYKAKLTEDRILKDSLFWAYIDMESNGGNGEIKSINTLVDTGDFSSTTTEFIRAEDGSHWWMIQSVYHTDSMRIYKLNSSGVTLHKTQKIGNFGEILYHNEMYQRSIVSASGEIYLRWCLPNYFKTRNVLGLEAFHFDRENGEFISHHVPYLDIDTDGYLFRSMFAPRDSSNYFYLSMGSFLMRSNVVNWYSENKIDSVFTFVVNHPAIPWDKYKHRTSAPSIATVRGPDCRFYMPSFVPDNKMMIMEEKFPRPKDSDHFLDRHPIKNTPDYVYEIPFNHNFQAPYMPEFLSGTVYEDKCLDYELDLIPLDLEGLQLSNDSTGVENKVEIKPYVPLGE